MTGTHIVRLVITNSAVMPLMARHMLAAIKNKQPYISQSVSYAAVCTTNKGFTPSASMAILYTKHHNSRLRQQLQNESYLPPL